MKYTLNIFNLFLASRFAVSFATYISGGSHAKYNQYPHSVLLDITCGQRCICGGSILNQNIVITAAHCLYNCVSSGFVAIKYGHEDIYKMKSVTMLKFVIHEHYDDELVINDICLVMAANKIKLSNTVKRVIIMENPSVGKYAYVAGWGMDEHGYTRSILKHTRVELRKPKVCALINRDGSRLPPGLFCAGPITGIGTALNGDSGSGLIVDEYIEIGIVSFKCQQYSMVAYTNVSYYLKWIKKNARRLYCYKFYK